MRPKSWGGWSRRMAGRTVVGTAKAAPIAVHSRGVGGRGL